MSAGEPDPRSPRRARAAAAAQPASPSAAEAPPRLRSPLPGAAVAGLPEEVAAALAAGARTLGADGRYILLREVGRGAMGSVWRGYDALLGRPIAAKLFLDRLGDDQATMATPRQPGSGTPPSSADQAGRFLREARILAAMEHRNIAGVYDLGIDGGRPWLAMQWIEGRTIDRAGLTTWQEIGEAITEAARGLHHAHRAGITHQDLKPGNIMVEDGADGRRGRVVVVDFGVARVERAQANVTHTGALSIAGTPAFMSPEQAAGRLDEVGPRSDVFGLGATCYALLAGRPPYRGGSQIEVLRAAALGQREPLARLRPDLPRSFAAVVERAMAGDPAERHPDMAAFAQELAEAVSGRREEEARQRGRRRIAIAAAAAALAIAAGVAGWLARERAQRAAAHAAALDRARTALAERDWAAADQGADAMLALGVDVAAAEALRERVREGRSHAHGERIQRAAGEAIAGGDWERARQAAEEWQRLCPQDAQPRELLERIRLGAQRARLLDRLAEAERRLAAGDLDGADAEAVAALGIVADDPAATALRQAIEDRRAAAAIAAAMGEAVAALRAGRWLEGRAAAARVLALDPAQPEALALDRRLAAGERAAAAKPLVAKAQADAAGGRWADALAAAASAIALDPADAAAIALYDRIAATLARGDDIEAACAAAEVAALAGDWDRARILLQPAQRLDPRHPRVAKLDARIAEGVRARTAERAIEAARAALRARDWNRAAGQLAEAKRLAPEHPAIAPLAQDLDLRSRLARFADAYERGLAAERAGRWAEAAAAYQAILALAPDNREVRARLDALAPRPGPLWRIAAGARVLALAIDRDGTRLSAATAAGVRHWDPLLLQPVAGGGGDAAAIAAGLDPARGAAIADAAGGVRLAIDDRFMPAVPSGLAGDLRLVIPGPGRSAIAAAADGRLVRIADGATAALPTHRGGIAALALAPDGRRLYVGGGRIEKGWLGTAAKGLELTAIDTATWSVAATWAGAAAPATALAAGEDAVWSAHADRNLRRWRDGATVATVDLGEEATALAAAPGGRCLVGTAGGGVLLVEAGPGGSGVRWRASGGGTAAITALAVAGDGRRCWSADAEGMLHCWAPAEAPGDR